MLRATVDPRDDLEALATDRVRRFSGPSQSLADLVAATPSPQAHLIASLLGTDAPVTTNPPASPIERLQLLASARLAELPARWDAMTPRERQLLASAIEDELNRLRAARSATDLQTAYRTRLYDLALLSEFGSDLHGSAVNRLKQPSSSARPEFAELLGLAGEETRREVIAQGLSRYRSDRTRAVKILEAVRDRFPRDAEPAAILAVLEEPDPRLAFPAFAALISVGARPADVENAAGRVLATVREDAARNVLELLASAQPDTVRPSVSWRHLTVVLETGAVCEGFGARVAADIVASPDLERARQLGGWLETNPAADDEARLAAVRLVALTPGEIPAACLRWIAGTRQLRTAAIQAVATLDSTDAIALARMLVSTAAVTSLGDEARLLFAVASAELRQEIADMVMERAIEAAPVAEDIAAVWSEELLAGAIVRAAGRSARMIEEAERLEREGGASVAALEAQMVVRLVDTLDSALDRARGNDRIVDSLSRLRRSLVGETTEKPCDPGLQEAGPGEDVLEALERGGGVLHRDGTVTADSSVSEPVRLRALAVLARRDEAVASAFADALAADGTAARLMTALFDGSGAPLALRLPPEARNALLAALVRAGWSPERAWFEDERSGAWLASAVGHLSGTAPPPTRAIFASAIGSAQAAHARLVAARTISRERRDLAAMAVARTAAVVMAELDTILESYGRVWKALGDLGIEQVAALGSAIEPGDIDPGLHAVQGDAGVGRLVVRTTGLRLGDAIVEPARLTAEEA